MSTSSNAQAAADAIESMTEEELAAWIAAGDYTSIGGVDLDEATSQRIADAVGYPDVVGFGLDLGFGMPSDLVRSPTPPPIGGHVAVPGQVHAKPGMNSFEFMKVTLTDILFSG